MQTERLTITVDQAAELLGISRSLAYDMARTGKLPALRFGKRFVIPRKAIENLMQQVEKTATQEQPSQEKSQW